MGSANTKSKQKSSKTPKEPVAPIQTEVVNEMQSGIRQNLVKHHDHINSIWDFYEKRKVLGEGMTGSVVEVVKIGTNKQYAMKQIKKVRIDAKMLESLRMEINLLKELDHPNCIKLYETYEDKRSIFMIMDECTGGELFDRLAEQAGHKYTEAAAAKLVRQMLRSIAYCHSKGICHRDLKLENFVFETTEPDAQLKLIDFGLSCKYGASQEAGGVQLKRMSSVVGTPYYIAPEILKNEGYSVECDMWSMGVITYILLTGRPPFNDVTDKGIMQKVMKGNFNKDNPAYAAVSKDAKNFVESLLKMNPKHRLTAVEALKHTWLENTTNEVSNLAEALNPDIVDSLIHFDTYSKFKQTALEALAFTLSVDEIKDLRRAFEAIDADGNGIITMEELTSSMEKSGITDDKTLQLFKSIDTNKSGLISYSEFLAATMRKKIMSDEERLIEAFDKLDRDGNGYLEIDDFMALMGKDFKQEEVEEMIRSADKSKDGKIDFDEFIQMMRGAYYKATMDPSQPPDIGAILKANPGLETTSPDQSQPQSPVPQPEQTPEPLQTPEPQQTPLATPDPEKQPEIVIKS